MLRKIDFCRLERLSQVLYLARYAWTVDRAVATAGGSVLVSRAWAAAICCFSSTTMSAYVAFVTFADHHSAKCDATWMFAVAAAVPTTLPSLMSDELLATV